MKKLIVLIAALVCVSALTWAAAPKTYQVTGHITEMSDSMICIQKGSERWEIARDSLMKLDGGELKVGAKVTIEYTMKAVRVTVKDEGKAANTGKSASTGKDEKVAEPTKPIAKPPAQKANDTAMAPKTADATPK